MNLSDSFFNFRSKDLQSGNSENNRGKQNLDISSFPSILISADQVKKIKCHFQLIFSG